MKFFLNGTYEKMLSFYATLKDLLWLARFYRMLTEIMSGTVLESTLKICFIAAELSRTFGSIDLT